MSRTNDRGYGSNHQRERRRWKRKVDTGTIHCWRCGTQLDPQQPWDLGHDDNDRTVYRGPECIPCNRATAGRNTQHTKRWTL